MLLAEEGAQQADAAGRIDQRHDSLAVSLADDAQIATIHVVEADVADVQRQRLADADPGLREEGKEQPVARMRGGDDGEERCHLIRAQGARGALWEHDRVKQTGWIGWEETGALRPRKAGAECGAAPGEGGRGAIGGGAEEGAEVIGSHCGRVEVRKLTREQLQISAIGAPGVAAQGLLFGHEKGGDQFVKTHEGLRVPDNRGAPSWSCRPVARWCQCAVVTFSMITNLIGERPMKPCGCFVWSSARSRGRDQHSVSPPFCPALVKRAMYGRAKFDLLRQRVLYTAN